MKEGLQSSLPKARRIVAEFDALQADVDALKRLQAETAAELDALLPAILDRAFNGELQSDDRTFPLFDLSQSIARAQTGRGSPHPRAILIEA